MAPDDRARHVEQELGQPIRGQSRNVAKDDRKGDRRQQWLDKVPERPQNGLFIDRHKVAPHEKQHQVAIAPQLAQPQVEPTAPWSNNHRPVFAITLRFRHCGHYTTSDGAQQAAHELPRHTLTAYADIPTVA